MLNFFLFLFSKNLYRKQRARLIQQSQPNLSLIDSDDLKEKQEEDQTKSSSKQLITHQQNFNLNGCRARGCENLLLKANSEVQIANLSSEQQNELGKSEVRCKAAIAKWEEKIIMKTEKIK